MAILLQDKSFQIEELGEDLVLQLIVHHLEPEDRDILLGAITSKIQPAAGTRLWTDFARIPWLGNRELGLLMALHKQLSPTGVRVVAVNLAAEALEVAKLVRLDHVLDTRRTLPEGPFLDTSEDEAGFLEAIIQDPEDDTVRLIFADWLDDRDDPRGEFIRVQCQLASNPGSTALRKAERDLQARCGPLLERTIRWLARQWEFRRGFIEHVSMSKAEFLATSYLLARLAPIRELRIGGVFPLEPSNVASALRAWPALQNLTRLELGNCNLRDADIQTLAATSQLGRLKIFDLQRNHIGDEGAQALASSPHLAGLSSLDLRGNTELSPEARQLLRARFGEVLTD